MSYFISSIAIYLSCFQALTFSRSLLKDPFPRRQDGLQHRFIAACERGVHVGHGGHRPRHGHEALGEQMELGAAIGRVPLRLFLRQREIRGVEAVLPHARGVGPAPEALGIKRNS